MFALSNTHVRLCTLPCCRLRFRELPGDVGWRKEAPGRLRRGTSGWTPQDVAKVWLLAQEKKWTDLDSLPSLYWVYGWVWRGHVALITLKTKLENTIIMTWLYCSGNRWAFLLLGPKPLELRLTEIKILFYFCFLYYLFRIKYAEERCFELGESVLIFCVKCE